MKLFELFNARHAVRQRPEKKDITLAEQHSTKDDTHDKISGMDIRPTKPADSRSRNSNQ